MKNFIPVSIIIFFAICSSVYSHDLERKGNAWYFYSKKVFSLDSDCARIEIAKVELGEEKVAEISAVCLQENGKLDEKKLDEMLVKQYYILHPEDIKKLDIIGSSIRFLERSSYMIAAVASFYGLGILAQNSRNSYY